MKINIIALFVALALTSIGGARAEVIQTTGSGSAVFSANASADFENPASLFDNPYLEGGMSFSRTGLTFNNNGCGFAGCSSGVAGPFSIFSGNYMYGVGSGGFFEISTTGGTLFTGLEFAASSGGSGELFLWEAFLGGTPVGGGLINEGIGIYGFSDPIGFDRLKFTQPGSSSVAPAFDSVRASVALVPVPAALPLLLTSLAGLGLIGWRRRKTA